MAGRSKGHSQWLESIQCIWNRAGGFILNIFGRQTFCNVARSSLSSPTRTLDVAAWVPSVHRWDGPALQVTLFCHCSSSRGWGGLSCLSQQWPQGCCQGPACLLRDTCGPGVLVLAVSGCVLSSFAFPPTVFLMRESFIKVATLASEKRSVRIPMS